MVGLGGVLHGYTVLLDILVCFVRNVLPLLGQTELQFVEVVLREEKRKGSCDCHVIRCAEEGGVMRLSCDQVCRRGGVMRLSCDQVCRRGGVM